jgi:uncharacterized membrane protein
MEDKQFTFGPVQMLAVAFDGNRFKGEILPELDRLKTQGIVRVIDLLVVRKDTEGRIAVLTATDLDWEEMTSYGAYVGTLVGFGAGGPEGADTGAIAGAAEFATGHVFDAMDIERLTSVVPNETTVAVVLLEHLWIMPLLGAIERAYGFELTNDWVRAEDLVQLGLRAALADEDLDPT